MLHAQIENFTTSGSRIRDKDESKTVQKHEYSVQYCNLLFRTINDQGFEIL